MTAAIISFAAAVVLVIIDYVIKQIVVANMFLGESIPAIKGLLDWTYITNEGASWGMMSGKTGFLVTITAILMVLMIVLLFSGKIKHWLGYAAFSLIIAGGVGNLIDRVFNDGKVIDYIDISPIFDFPIFNFADCCVTVGGVLLCAFILFVDEAISAKETDSVKE